MWDNMDGWVCDAVSVTGNRWKCVLCQMYMHEQAMPTEGSVLRMVAWVFCRSAWSERGYFRFVSANLCACVQVRSFNSSGGLSHLECFGQLHSAMSPWEEVKSQYRDTCHGLFCTQAKLPEHWPSSRSLNEPCFLSAYKSGMAINIKLSSCLASFKTTILHLSSKYHIHC